MNSRKQKELQENIAFFREQFESLNTNIELPYALQADVLFEKHQEFATLPVAKRRTTPWMRALAGTAACFVIVLGSLFALRPSDGVEQAQMQESAAVDFEMADTAALFMAENQSQQAFYATDYTQVRDAVFDLTGGYAAYQDMNDISMAQIPESVYSEPMDGGELPRKSESMPNMMSVAGLQKEASSDIDVNPISMDEPRLVKTDGEYLYSFVDSAGSSNASAILIVDVENMALTSKIEIEQTQLHEFYISDDHLVTVGYHTQAIPASMLPKDTVVQQTNDQIYSEIGGGNATQVQLSDVAGVEVAVYDISNPQTPTLQYRFKQAGEYTASNLTEDVLFLVSNKYVSPGFDNKETAMAELVPVVQEDAQKQARLLPADQIALVPNAQSPVYAVISILELDGGLSQTQAVLGGDSCVHLSPDSVYITHTAYEQNPQEDESLQTTYITRFEAGRGKLEMKNTATLDGYVTDSSALSEWNGNLRVAVTNEHAGAGSAINIYVFDSNMQQIGTLERLAGGGQIHAIHYVEGLAYMMTSLPKDPLIVVDFTDPFAPKIRNQLENPGLGGYLRQVDEDTMLGIGQSSKEGIYLQLWDVSDPALPKLLHTHSLGAGSGLWESRKALLLDVKRGLLGFRATVEEKGQYCLLTFDKENGFTPLKLFDAMYVLPVSDRLYAGFPHDIRSYALNGMVEQQTLKIA